MVYKVIADCLGTAKTLSKMMMCMTKMETVIAIVADVDSIIERMARLISAISTETGNVLGLE